MPSSRVTSKGQITIPKEIRHAVIGLDTNVIVRFLVEDDARQAKRARKNDDGFRLA